MHPSKRYFQGELETGSISFVGILANPLRHRQKVYFQFQFRIRWISFRPRGRARSHFRRMKARLHQLRLNVFQKSAYRRIPRRNFLLLSDPTGRRAHLTPPGAIWSEYSLAVLQRGRYQTVNHIGRVDLRTRRYSGTRTNCDGW